MLAEREVENMQKKEQDTKNLKKQKLMIVMQLVECSIALVIFACGVFAYMTKAWYAKNRELTGENSSVTSASTTSLFIERGTTLPEPKNYYTSVSHQWANTAALYPISTKDCANWWYASKFENVSDGNGNMTLQATQYTQLTAGATASTTVVAEDSNVGTYLNALEGSASRVAYLYEDYMLYTTDQDLAVYLHPTNPITVSYQDNGTTARQLNEALRVAIVVGDGNGALKLFYAPITETGSGNSANAVTGFSNVKNATEVEAFTMSTISNYQAAAVQGDPYTFTAGTTSLGTAGTSGLHVRVYIWLEGTDAQALIGVSDKDIKGINVNVSFVGVAQ
jgi:cytoskeletal protein RodZ